MKPGIRIQLAIVAILGISLPITDAKAADGVPIAKGQRVITDVTLTQTGDLLGAVVQNNGHPLAGQTVQVLSNNKVVAVAKTDVAGRYRIKGLRNGVHQVNTRHQQQVCRLWKHAAAPPTAQKGLITAQSAAIMRGQNDGFIEIGSTQMLGLAVFGGATAATLVSTLGNDNTTSSSLSGSGGFGSGGNNDSTASP